MTTMSRHFTENEEREWSEYVAAARDAHAMEGRLRAWYTEQRRRARLAECAAPTSPPPATD